MPISSTTTDYSNRKKDIHILQGVNPAGFATVTPSFGRISNYCAGVQKLIQRYAISLLTELGSQTSFPNFGTDLLTKLVNSTGLHKVSVIHIFNFANTKVINSFHDYQGTVDDPEDEMLDSAELIDIIAVNGSISLSILLYPVTADAVQFVLPLPTTN